MCVDKLSATDMHREQERERERADRKTEMEEAKKLLLPRRAWNKDMDTVPDRDTDTTQSRHKGHLGKVGSFSQRVPLPADSTW